MQRKRTAYYTYTHADHASCNAHHLREFAFLQERYPQAWEGEMVELLLKIKQTVAETMAKGQSCLAPDQVLAFEKRYDELVEDGLALNLAPQKPPGQRGRGQTNPAKKPARPLAQSQNSRVGFYVRC